MAEIRDYSTNPDPQTADRWPEGMAMSSVNDTGRVDEGILARWYRDTRGDLVSTGSANAYVVAPNRSFADVTSGYDGLELQFQANFTNTGAATLAAGDIPATTIKDNLTGVDLVGSEIVSGTKVKVVHNGTNWVLTVNSAAQLVLSTRRFGNDIQATIDAVSAAGGGVAFVDPGDYQVSTPIRPKSNVILRGAGYASRIFVATDIATIKTDAPVSNVTIEYLRVEGNGDATPNTNDHIIEFNDDGGCSDITVQSCTIQNGKGDGVHFRRVTRGKALNNNISGVRWGVGCFKGNNDIEVASNFIRRARSIGVFFDDATESDTAGTAEANIGFLVTDNQFIQCGRLSDSWGINIAGSSDGIVSDNRIYQQGIVDSVISGGITVNNGQDELNRATDVIVVDNKIIGSYRHGIRIRGVKDVVVADNKIIDVWQDPSASTAVGSIEVTNGAASVFEPENVFTNGNMIVKGSGLNVYGILVSSAGAIKINTGANQIDDAFTQRVFQVQSDANKSESKGEFIRLGNDLIIQYGRTNVAGNTTVDETLPIAFPTAHHQSYANYIASNTSQTATPQARPGTTTPLTTVTLTNPAGASANISWLCIGD